MRPWSAACAASALAAATALAGPAARERPALGYTYAAGAFRPEYVPPAPGTYALPPIRTVRDHPLLDSDGHATTLQALQGDRVAVIAFVYTTCVDAAGCPVSNAVLKRLDGALAADPALARGVRLVTVSFDPERDTPARMAQARALYAPRTDWRFLTTRGEADLAPLLADFGQSVVRLRLPDGRWSGLFRHVLEVYLLDPRQAVRNIYSTAFLDPVIVLNDVRTLLLERDGQSSLAKSSAAELMQ